MRILLIFIFSFFFVSANTVDPKDTNSKMKVTFLYSFTKYIEWPPGYKEGNFVIGVLGNTPLFSELNNMAASKMMGSQKIEIKMFSSTSSISRCHVLFVPQENQGSFQDVINKVKGQSTLLITEKAGLAKQGAAINFVVADNKQKFELNKSNVEKYDLKVSSSLSKVAIVVD